MVPLDFDTWGSTPFDARLTADPLVQDLLFLTRMKSRSSSELAEILAEDLGLVNRVVAALSQADLLRPSKTVEDRWSAGIPIYSASELAASEEIGWKHAQTEASILRDRLPGLRRIFESCEVARRFPWESMSLITVGALVADLCVYDRVRFFPSHSREEFLPPLHPDGSRWGYVGYEKRTPRFPRKRWAFYQNLDTGPAAAGTLAMFGFFDPPSRRQTRPQDLFAHSLRALVLRLGMVEIGFDEMLALSGLLSGPLRDTLDRWVSANPPAIRTARGRYSLNLPILSQADLAALVKEGDAIAEAIHIAVTIPWHDERAEAGKQMGLPFPLADSCLARDIALGALIDDGELAPVPDPPVPWSFGVWGWCGMLPQWEVPQSA